MKRRSVNRLKIRKKVGEPAVFESFDFCCLCETSEGWKDWFFSLVSTVCGDFSSHRRSSAGDVPLSARSIVVCVSNHRK